MRLVRSLMVKLFISPAGIRDCSSVVRDLISDFLRVDSLPATSRKVLYRDRL